MSAASAICGLELNTDSLLFSEVEFQVGGLTELAGTHPIAETNWPTKDTGNDQRFAMKWRSESEAVVGGGR